MDRRTALKALASLPVSGIVGSAAAAAAGTATPPILRFDDAGLIANANEVFAGVAWQSIEGRTDVERRTVNATIPREAALPVRDEPPTWDGKQLVPPPNQLYHGTVMVRQYRYVEVPFAKLKNPMDASVARLPVSTLVAAD